MTRATSVFSLSVLAIALVAFVYGISFRQSRDPVKSPPGYSGLVDHAASADRNPDASTVVVTQAVENNREKGNRETLVIEEERRNIDEAATREWVREETTREVQEDYSLLLQHLDLTSSELKALLEFLIEDAIASSKTAYSSGEGLDEGERSVRIAEIIGGDKLKKFLALERNIGEYRELQYVQAMLEQKGVPLTDTQQDRLLGILIDTREKVDMKQPADIKRGTLESLEHTLNQLDEYERLIMELVPSVLSTKQIEHMFERYQTRSYMRANALESHKQREADGSEDDLLLGYPSSRN